MDALSTTLATNGIFATILVIYFQYSKDLLKKRDDYIEKLVDRSMSAFEASTKSNEQMRGAITELKTATVSNTESNKTLSTQIYDVLTNKK